MSEAPAVQNEDPRQSQLKLLIAKGKEQGFLTYVEVNDHLPNDIVDPEQIEDIVNMINDMGIPVYEKAPENESVLLSDSAVSTDDDAADEAAAALASVDAEFGRTTDPVRMYMREMGVVELLTREGEIEIAKRIEQGLNQVRTSLSMFPATVKTLLGLYDSVVAEESRLVDVITGYIDPNAPDVIASPNAKSEDDDDDDDDEVVDTGPDPEEAARRFGSLREKLDNTVDAIKKRGTLNPETHKMRRQVSAEFMELKLAPKVFERLAESLRSVINEIRTQERAIMAICVRQAGMPRKDFISSFPKNETNLEWIDKHIRAKRKHSSTLVKLKVDILRAQRKLINTETHSLLSIEEIKEINRQMSIGEAKARRAKKEMVEANLRLVFRLRKNTPIAVCSFWI